MKLQKHLSRKAKNGENYYKYEVILTKELVKKAGLKAGDELEGEARKGEVKLKRR